ncbi:hypothetical protein FIA58_011815 [Flavobacterium jejuense]|uniref:Uncharacterized protein n=1 Tax=Flavobacterium jejuense TaxID=1544455 RepID=A0ABX0IU85_9FLAO|nr:hypothetical protein [Flavobacterium jejuense]NHN26367.1 hypothetical protein [Flavobacterium jejuense]
MTTLTFTPRTTIDANILQFRIDDSSYYAIWNIWASAYEFEELEEELSLSITYDINGYFEIN